MSFTFLSPMTHTYINLPTKWGYTKLDLSTQPSGDILIVYTLLKYRNDYIILPMHSGGTNYIIDIHEIYNRDQISKQDHDSHQQLSYTMYDLHHKHLSATSKPTTYIFHYLFPRYDNVISSTCEKVCHI